MSCEQDLHSNIYVVPAIVPASVTGNTPIQSAIIDTEFDEGFYGLEFITVIGAIATSGASFVATLIEGDQSNLSDGAAVNSDFLIGSGNFLNTNAGGCRRVGYVGKKRYVRYTITPTGNTGAALFGVAAVLAFPRSAATDENT